MTLQQLSLFVDSKSTNPNHGQNINASEILYTVLSGDLNFHNQDSNYASHNFHPFPAKFPPQLPRKLINALTKPGDTVLDPMMGSGTTLVEAHLSDRIGIGFDIDPLAVRLAMVKTTAFDKHTLTQTANKIIKNASKIIRDHPSFVEDTLYQNWNSKTREFVDYWFSKETQLGLAALIWEINKIDNVAIHRFFEMIFSGIIITKSGGVSLAFDLAHTRPHRAKIVYDTDGNIVIGQDLPPNPSPRLKLLTKKLRSPIDEFSKRFSKQVAKFPEYNTHGLKPIAKISEAQDLPLENSSVDLIVTSPPYAANAIDYMRAHKFSLVWMGYSVDELSQKRRDYIGGEATSNFVFESLPVHTANLVAKITALDKQKGNALRRYYSEMTGVLQEMHRVLKPGRAAIIVVGNSVMRGQNSETGQCLAEIGTSLGFNVPHIGIRYLDRNKRMMPAGKQVDKNSQIQQRMHQEYIIGYVKPEATA